MDPVANLNFGRDSSTKFKLKLDNSKVKLAAPETSEDSRSKTLSANTATENSRTIKNGQVTVPRHDNPRLPFFEEDYYIDSMLGYNARLLSQRGSLQFDRSFGLEGLCDLEATQLKNMQMNIPVVMRLSTGQLFYTSNSKLEPVKVSAEEFVKMNVHHQNTLFDTEKGGFSNFAPRRRRRGTLKGFKNTKGGN